MRITTNMIYDRNLASMSKVSEPPEHRLQPVDDGDKFSPGEDPAGMSQKMALTKRSISSSSTASTAACWRTAWATRRRC